MTLKEKYPEAIALCPDLNEEEAKALQAEIDKQFWADLTEEVLQSKQRGPRMTEAEWEEIWNSEEKMLVIFADGTEFEGPAKEAKKLLEQKRDSAEATQNSSKK